MPSGRFNSRICTAHTLLNSMLYKEDKSVAYICTYICMCKVMDGSGVETHESLHIVTATYSKKEFYIKDHFTNFCPFVFRLTTPPEPLNWEVVTFARGFQIFRYICSQFILPLTCWNRPLWHRVGKEIHVEHSVFKAKSLSQNFV
jgi:hypothetical protein